jgi:hypothetical protein
MKKYQLILISVVIIAVISGGAVFASITGGKTKSKKELKEEKKSEKSIEKKEKTTDGEISISEENVTKTAIETFPIPDESKSGYIKQEPALLRADITTASAVIIKLKKRTKIKIEEEKKDATGKSWTKLIVKSDGKDLSGWTYSENIVKEYKDLLTEKYSSLDFTPYPKVVNYPGNSRQKVKGIYMTLYSASGERLNKLIDMTKRTKINAFVIDVKDDNGNMLFKTAAADKYVPNANKSAPIKDIKALMKKLKDNNIYTIARIVCFKDPQYAKAYPDRVIVYKNSGAAFVNADKLTWVTAYDRDLWAYNVAVSKEAAEAGFNEIQFDYVRFPASNGGKLDSSLNYRNINNETKPQAIQEYLKYARKELSPKNVYISADIYGLVGSVEDDMGLGQHWEAVSNIVDYTCPMMYPSHYGNGSYGLSVPDAYPYQTVYKSTKDGVERNKNIKTPAMIRPWIQDFTAAWVKGHIKYGETQVKEQIKALEDNGIEEYLLWNAGNRYTEGALQ